MKSARIIRILFLLCIVSTSNTVFAQTTAFSYQGRLSEAGSPVTGTRFFRFTLFDTGGAAIPGAAVEQTLTATNGVFNTSLDFCTGGAITTGTSILVVLPERCLILKSFERSDLQIFEQATRTRWF